MQKKNILIIYIIIMFIGTSMIPAIQANMGNNNPIKLNGERGNILIYSVTSSGTEYDRSCFKGNLTMILESYGYSVTVTDRIENPVITSSLLIDYDEFWFLSTYAPSETQLNESEINTILHFRDEGFGLLIMADHTGGGMDYSDDANQISTPLGVTFFGVNYNAPNGAAISPTFVPHSLFANVSTIVGHNSMGQMTVSTPSQVVATYIGDNLIAALDDGNGRVVFDVSFTKLWNAGFQGKNWILVGDTPQYVKNIADWLMYTPVLKTVFIIGKISNLDLSGRFNTFNANNIRWIQFLPFGVIPYSSGEQIKITKQHLGVLNQNVIFGFYNAVI